MILKDTWKKLLVFIEEQSLWIVLFLVSLLVLLLIISLFKKARQKKKRHSSLISDTVSSLIEEKTKAETVLDDFDIGVISYAADGSLIGSNKAGLEILKIKEAPTTFKAFLQQFGRENGLQAGIILGTDINEAIYEVEGRSIKIRVKNANTGRTLNLNILIAIQDITLQEQENLRRKEFVANVSHELRTPLTTIKTYTESLLDWGLEEKKSQSVRKDITRVYEDALRMETLVNNLLLLSKIDNQAMVAGMEQFDLDALTRSLVERMQVQAREKKITLECYSLGVLPWVFADRTAIDTILGNVISNSIKYTENGGKVTVYLGKLLDDVYVKISDTGFGIAEEKIPYIFDRFYRVDMTGSRMYGGTGLGLAIAKELTEYHGGDISVQSVLGKGTDFVVKLPSAGEIFTEALDYFQNPDKYMAKPIYITAGDLLLNRSRELGMEIKNLSDLNKEDKKKLIEKSLYNS